MSFSILEALFFKKPMLLSNIEANFETAKSAAIYVNPKSYAQVCRSLKLFKSDKIKRLISNNANYIYTNFYDKKLTLDSYYNEL